MENGESRQFPSCKDRLRGGGCRRQLECKLILIQLTSLCPDMGMRFRCLHVALCVPPWQQQLYHAQENELENKKQTHIHAQNEPTQRCPLSHLILIRLDGCPAHLNVHHARLVEAAAHVCDDEEQRGTPLDDLPVVGGDSIGAYPHRTVVGT